MDEPLCALVSAFIKKGKSFLGLLEGVTGSGTYQMPDKWGLYQPRFNFSGWPCFHVPFPLAARNVLSCAPTIVFLTPCPHTVHFDVDHLLQ